MQSFNKIEKVKGELNLPGDKSISHRALIFSSLAEGNSVIENISFGEDVKSTADCFTNLGCRIGFTKDTCFVEGRGFKGFTEPANELYAGNSGTTARLLSGILIHQSFETIITGDESLSKRPMRRIIEPLQSIGAEINGTKENTLPLIIKPSNKITHADIILDVPSAQVKSALLLSGLHMDGITRVTEKYSTRDHTEKMLNLNIIKETGTTIEVSRADYPIAGTYYIPGDISTAAFFIVLALLAEESNLTIKNISLNETRSTFLQLLRRMGATIEQSSEKSNHNEPYGDLVISNSKLKNINFTPEMIPLIIDEIPILSVAGLFAEGDFVLNHAKELRYKESDRIKALCYNYRLLGLKVEEYDDGFSLSGEIKNKDVVFESFNDHRIAMTFSILSLLLCNGGKVDNFNCISISNPDFINQLKQITG